MTDLIFYTFPALLVGAALYFHLRAARGSTVKAIEVLKEAEESGLTEPPSLHPVVDLSVCMGSGACVKSCPEKALGVIKGKAVLINPTHCIGHGACASACPVGAIRLVFGTAKRGIEIPQVKSDFETNVPGVFIAGELGGMGLIRNAVRQGAAAVRTIAGRSRGANSLDVVIIGAGPAGIAASLAAEEHKLRYVTIEQEDSLGGTTYHYPRNKLVMTAPMQLPLVGQIKVREVSKEALMEIWQGILDRFQPKIQFGERMEELIPQSDGFTVRTNRGSYQATSVLLAIGRRGTPRKLGAPGEDQAKVVYRLIDPEQYRGTHVLVVGGGDSALEAALDLSREPGTTVTLSYRGSAFGRVKPKNRTLIDAAEAQGRVAVMLESQVVTIEADHVVMRQGDATLTLPNQHVIICAGGELPTPMLKKIGVQVEAHYGS